MSGGQAVGVDVGQAFTTAALFRDGRVATLRLADGDDAVPSVVALAGDDPAGWTVGAPAGPVATARGFVSALGQSDPLVYDGRSVRAEDLVGRLLAHAVARSGTGSEGRPAHLTVAHPARWGPHTLGVLRLVVEALGVPSAGIVARPVAVATHYAATADLAPEAALVVYDAGAASVEVTVVRRGTAGFAVVGEPQATTARGGDELDRLLTAHLGGQLPGWAALDPFDPTVARDLDELRRRARAVREELSAALAADATVALGGEQRDLRVTRREYEDLARRHIDDTLVLVEDALASAGLGAGDIAGVVLAGGTSRTPLVATRLSDRFGAVPLLAGDPRYGACLGATVVAGATAGLRGPNAGTGFGGPAPAPVSPPGSGGERRPPVRSTPTFDVPTEAVVTTRRRQAAEAARAAHTPANSAEATVPQVVIDVDLQERDLAGAGDRNVLTVPLEPSVEPFRRRLGPLRATGVETDAITDAPVPTARLLAVAAAVVIALVLLVVLLVVLL